MRADLFQNVIFGMLNRLSFFFVNISLFYLLTPKEYGIYGLTWTTINTLAALGVQPAGHGYRRELIENRWPPVNLAFFYYFSSFSIVLIGFIAYLLLKNNVTSALASVNLLVMSFCICIISVGPYSLVFKRKILQANKGIFLANFLYLAMILVNFFSGSLSIKPVMLMLGVSLLLGAFWVIYLECTHISDEKLNFWHWITSSDRSIKLKFMLPILFQSFLGMPVLLLAQTVIASVHGLEALGILFLIIQISNLVGIAARKIMEIITPKVLAYRQSNVIRRFFRYYFVACILMTVLAIACLSIASQLSNSVATIDIWTFIVFMIFSMFNVISWFYSDILNSSGGQKIVLRSNIYWAIGATVLVFTLQSSFTSPVLLYAFSVLGTKLFVFFYLKMQLNNYMQVQVKGESTS